jgi:hypothetical protein
VKRELSGRQLTEELDDKTLPICWRGRRPFKSLKDVRKYFKPLALSFINGGKAKIQFELPPEAYLIISVIPVPSFLVSVATLCQNSKLTNNMLSLSLSLYIYIYIQMPVQGKCLLGNSKWNRTRAGYFEHHRR